MRRKNGYNGFYLYLNDLLHNNAVWRVRIPYLFMTVKTGVYWSCWPYTVIIRFNFRKSVFIHLSHIVSGSASACSTTLSPQTVFSLLLPTYLSSFASASPTSLP